MEDPLARIRACARHSIGRGWLFGLLAIATCVSGLIGWPVMAMRVAAILSMLMTAIMLLRGLRAPARPYRRTETWVLLGTGLPVWCSGAAAPPSVAGLTFVAWQQPIGCGGVAVFPDDWVLVDDDGAVLIPQKLIDEVCASAPEQERMEGWIMGEVEKGVVLPGLYPMNAETKARYEASRKG